MDPHVPLTGNPRPGYFHVVSLGLLIFLPVTLFMIAMSFMTFLFHSIPALCWLVVLACTALSLMFMMVRQARDGPKYWFNLGVICFMGVIVGTTAGLWNYERNMEKYWAYQGQRAYNGVGPTEPALRYLDAGKIVFTTDAEIDAANAYASVSGSTYCVAPIVKSGTAEERPPQFWAVGVDCCAEGKFTCDDAQDPTAHSGLVFLDDFALPDYEVVKFREATRAALVSRGLPRAQGGDALLVRWVKDVNAAHQQYWFSAADFVMVGLGVYTSFSVFAGFMVHFTSRRVPVKSRMEVRSFGAARY